MYMATQNELDEDEFRRIVADTLKETKALASRGLRRDDAGGLPPYRIEVPLLPMSRLVGFFFTACFPSPAPNPAKYKPFAVFLIFVFPVQLSPAS